MPHTDAVVVLTTVASEDEAVKLVRTLLERRLIACGTLFPGARSLYRCDSRTGACYLMEVNGRPWGSLQLAVDAGVNFPEIAVQSAFGELHPYKVPELLAMPVSSGLDKYLDWINSETTLALT